MWAVAQVSFSGRVSMYAGEVRDLMQGEVLDDLLAAGYVVPQETTKQPIVTIPTTPKTTQTKQKPDSKVKQPMVVQPPAKGKAKASK